jgi:hypothetical protein
MKTRQNHRKTTMSRRRRRVVKQQRVQTRIHRRKGTTVSSGRRHHFFKRGGEPFSSPESRKFGTYSNDSRRISSFGQINRDRDDAAAAQVKKDAEKAQEIGYRDVDEFVSKTKTTNVSIKTDIPNIKFIVKKLPKKDFYIDNVKNGKSQQPVTKTINEKDVKFYVDSDGNTVVIYVDGTLYGYVMIKIDGNEYDSSNRGIYTPIVSDAIKKELELTPT